MKKETTVIFNDLVIGRTSGEITYEKEYPSQKKYIFTNVKSGLTAFLFTDDLILVSSEGVIVEVED